MTLLLSSLSDLQGRYDRIYCDIWGVVHNGAFRHQSAVDALTEFRRDGGQVVLVTNAPRPATDILPMLERLQVSSDAYDAIVSSGDVTRMLLSEYAGQVVHHVGPDYDMGIFEGTGVILGEAEEAKVLIVSDLDEKGEDPADYTDRLEHWLSLGLDMICANPDKVVEVGDQLVYCGGALADIYEQMGGKIIMAGKPFAPIYQAARDLLTKQGLPDVLAERSLAIGDAARTDARGAAGQNADFLFIAGSIHHDELYGNGKTPSDADVQILLAETGANLAGWMKVLA